MSAFALSSKKSWRACAASLSAVLGVVAAGLALATYLWPDVSWLGLLSLTAGLLLLQAVALGHFRGPTRLHPQSSVDPLTGLADAPSFRALVHGAFARPGAKLALLYIELRHVALLRSTFGREALETLYQAVGRRLRADLRTHDGLAHFGDGLFAVALRDTGGRAELATIAARLRTEIAKPLLIGGTRIRPSWDASAVLAPVDAETAADLLVAADAAREVARVGGDEPLRWLPASSRTALESRRARQRELLEAKEAGSFFPVFQPQLDFRTGRIERAEVLMRWQRSDGRVVGPAEFLEELRLLDALPAVSLQVYGAALAEASLWRAQGRSLGRLALNLDATQAAEAGWADTLLRLIAASELPASCVELEVSENILASVDLPILVDGLEVLRAAGVAVSLDDFGTGFASLTQIANLPIDLVKLDSRLLWDASSSVRKLVVVEGVVALVDRLGLPCLLEGIETPAQLALARSIGGALGQGFLIGRPMPAPEIEALFSAAARTPAPSFETMRLG